MGTVVAEGQRDAFLRTDISYNKCHEWTSSWTSMESVGLQIAESMRFRTHICLSFMLWYILSSLTIFGTFVFSHYEQVYGTQKVCISGPMFIGVFFFLFWWLLPPLKILDTFVFIHCEQVYRTQKVCVSGPMCNGLFFVLWYVLPPLTVLDTFVFSHYEQLYRT